MTVLAMKKAVLRELESVVNLQNLLYLYLTQHYIVIQLF